MEAEFSIYEEKQTLLQWDDVTGVVFAEKPTNLPAPQQMLAFMTRCRSRAYI